MSQTKDFINEHNDIVEMDLRQLSKERSFGRIFGVFPIVDALPLCAMIAALKS
jgi:hypothetical protein